MADQAANEERQLVVFDLSNESYGVEINAVREIIRVQAVTRVPDAPEYVQGVMNLRGSVIPVIDLRSRFGLEAVEQTDESRIVVVDIDGEGIGMSVDAVTEVLRISEASIEPPSALVSTEESYYIQGIVRLESRLLILLELERVLSEGSARRAETVAAASSEAA